MKPSILKESRTPTVNCLGNKEYHLRSQAPWSKVSLNHMLISFESAWEPITYPLFESGKLQQQTNQVIETSWWSTVVGIPQPKKTRPRLARKHNIASEVGQTLKDAFFLQVGLRKLLCASCSVQVALCKLLRASCSLQIAPCKWLPASCSVQIASCKLLPASCSVQAALCKLLCASCSA